MPDAEHGALVIAAKQARHGAVGSPPSAACSTHR